MNCVFNFVLWDQHKLADKKTFMLITETIYRITKITMVQLSLMEATAFYKPCQVSCVDLFIQFKLISKFLLDIELGIHLYCQIEQNKSSAVLFLYHRVVARGRCTLLCLLTQCVCVQVCRGWTGSGSASTTGRIWSCLSFTSSYADGADRSSRLYSLCRRIPHSPHQKICSGKNKIICNEFSY